MKIKTPTQFVVFNDGVCDIYSIDEENHLEVKFHTNFSNRTVGVKRFYSAKVAQVEISAVIRIPQNRAILARDVVVVGDQPYEIVQVQHINDTNPSISDLTLRQTGLRMRKNDGQIN